MGIKFQEVKKYHTNYPLISLIFVTEKNGEGAREPKKAMNKAVTAS